MTNAYLSSQKKKAENFETITCPKAMMSAILIMLMMLMMEKRILKTDDEMRQRVKMTRRGRKICRDNRGKR